MKYYQDFLSKGCFCFDEAVDLVGNVRTAKSILRDYSRKSYIEPVKKGLYVAVNIYDQEPVVNKFIIGSSVSETACISHHSAFEYYGFANQIAYEMTVLSESKFNDFVYRGWNFHRVQPRITLGVIKRADGVRVTDLERTVLDSINDLDKYIGFEELIHCITSIPFLDENRLLAYLVAYKKQFLYQKTGFIFEHLQSEFNFSRQFYEICRKFTGKSSRYFTSEPITRDDMQFSSEWNLTYRKSLWSDIEEGTFVSG